ncbi:MAG: RNA 2',3'-cyclic phosphodiesterase [Chloroflexi bacterium]|nr:RNA 2',3'-cyclic phosphodiesterase [Chloroflexota bacterium]MBT5627713.1 RNA 2',3'-cyclic phosphodiesterase [Chloroflexota bacterium]
MTKSNDNDPSTSSEKEEVSKNEGVETPKAPKADVASDAPAAEDKPDWLIATGDDAPTSEASESDDSSSTTTEEQDSAEQTDGEWSPSSVPQRDRSRGELPYYGGRGRTGEAGTSFTRQTEAKFIPSEPKFYRAPDAKDEDEEEQFGFPEVPENTQRLFIAIEIPRKLKREFLDLAGSFRPDEHGRVRWISEDAMHLTLKFLGDIPNDQVVDIKNALNSAAESTGKFTIKVGRTGCFPSFRDPRILWVGFDGELRRLEQLAGRVEGRLVNLGLKEDDRNFRAHITTGRTRPGIRGRFAEDVGVAWQHAPLRNSGTSIPVNAIALYRSFLNDNGDTEYKQLANYELG